MDTTDLAVIDELVTDRRDRHLSLLAAGMERSVTDLDTFQEWVTTTLREAAVDVESFRLAPADVTDQPAYQRTIQTTPDALRTGPNIIGSREADIDGPSTLLFAHADTNPITNEQADDNPAFQTQDDRLIGPGIADDISGVTAILSAIELVDTSELRFEGELLVGSVLGKQLGVLGTYGLVTQYGPTDTAIYVHPAETQAGLNELKIGSNGICEFTIRIDGNPPETTEAMHTVFRASAVNPIEKAARVQDALLEWADTASEEYAYPPLVELADRSVSIMIGDVDVAAGKSVYSVPQSCTLHGTVCFPPTADLQSIQAAVRGTVEDTFSDDEWLGASTVELDWGDHMAESAATPADSPFLERTATAVDRFADRWPTHYYGHTASDIRYPLLYWDADTVGFGPQAGNMGSPAEWIDTAEYLDTIATIAAQIGTVEDG